eukprot:5563667-Pleurochrysis_carterae.AAC.1
MARRWRGAGAEMIRRQYEDDTEIAGLERNCRGESGRSPKIAVAEHHTLGAPAETAQTDLNARTHDAVELIAHDGVTAVIKAQTNLGARHILSRRYAERTSRRRELPKEVMLKRDRDCVLIYAVCRFQHVDDHVREEDEVDGDLEGEEERGARSFPAKADAHGQHQHLGRAGEGGWRRAKRRESARAGALARQRARRFAREFARVLKREGEQFARESVLVEYSCE